MTRRADINTECTQPVDKWGVEQAVVWDVGRATSTEIIRAPPQLIVGIDTDLLSLPKEQWEKGAK